MFGAAVNTWSGSNISAAASAGIAGGDVVFTVTDPTLPWNLETTTRAAGACRRMEYYKKLHHKLHYYFALCLSQ